MQHDDVRLSNEIDDALVRAIRSGGESAYQKVFDAHWPTIYFFILRNIRSPKLAEDATQFIFEGLWDHANHFRNADDLKHFLARGSSNAALFGMKKIAVSCKLMGLASDLNDYDEALEQLDLLRFNAMEIGFIRQGTDLSSVVARLSTRLKLRLFVTQDINPRRQ